MNSNNISCMKTREVLYMIVIFIVINVVVHFVVEDIKK